MKSGRSSEIRINNRINFFLAAGTFITIIVVSLASRQPQWGAAGCLGWLIAWGNHLLTELISDKTFSNTGDSFFKYSLGFNALRVLAVTMAVLVSIVLFKPCREFFIGSFLVTYFIFMAYEIFRWHKLSLQNQ